MVHVLLLENYAYPIDYPGFQSSAQRSPCVRREIEITRRDCVWPDLRAFKEMGMG